MASTLTDFRALVRFETDLWNEVERRLRAVEGAVSLGRHRILELAAADGSTRVQDIAEELLITVGAASRLADRLEADGLIARTPHPSDRRGSLIAPTESGRRALEITTPAIDSALEGVLGASGSAALATIAGLLPLASAAADAAR
ncbi:DNA-binding transcriptional regulator, MarR family [Rathayibacter oskolensis]|uniref:DNA-binding transcriptional regulator, MarR family n=1 Tax=Rathayibacter oskolensis TaxID=1891671 RepID=A0A1X7P248_9MICO|nr:MarR family transcriptional regulator [Rathayibacter oskolensis]SMH43986.1 DNA-binding transcriptional regulator, MarR family [Rathayibacter oskolensis]